MKNFLFILIVLTFSCSQPTTSKSQLVTSDKSDFAISDYFYKLCYGINEPQNLNSLDSSINYLNNSSYKMCLNQLTRIAPVSIVKFSGFYGYSAIETASDTGRIIQYILFRYDNFMNNLPIEEQKRMLLKSMSVDSSNDLYPLQNIEYQYLQNVEELDTEKAKNITEQIINLQENKKYAQSKRLNFILGIELLVNNNDKEALPIFKQLIADNYYSLICVKTLIDYFSNKNDIRSEEYIDLLRKKFPSECNLQLADSSLSEDSIKKICIKCINSDFQKDSIKANLLLAKYFLSKRNFVSLDSLLNGYFEHYTFILDSTLLFERGVYYDLKLRSLFIRDKYSELCKFVHEELGYNLVLDIKNDSDLIDYLEKLFVEYVSKDTKEFPIFLNNYFNTCLHQQFRSN